MKLIVTLLVLSSSLILSGILYAFDIVELTELPFRFWFIASILVSSIAFKIKFKSMSLFKFNVFRRYVELTKLYKKIDKKILVKNHTLTPLQEKTMKLWKLLIKDKNALMSCSILSAERQLRKNNILIILYPHTHEDYIMTIFDVNNDKRCLYEVHIPEDYVKGNTGIVTMFDNEIEKRLRSSENDIRKMIDDDLGKLIEIQEKSVS